MKPKIKKIIKWVIILVIIFITSFFGYNKYKKSITIDTEYITAKVERGNLEQTVSATGTIKPLTEVSLNFSNPKEITVLNVKKGDKVKKGDILAKQNDTSLQIAVQQAQANLGSAIATLNQLKAGASNEDIAVKSKGVASAQTAYDNAVKNLETLRIKTSEDIKTYDEAIKSAQTSLKDKQTNLADVKNKYSQTITNLEQSATTSMSGYVFTATSSLDSVDKTLTNSGALTDNQLFGNIAQLNQNTLISAQNAHEDAVNALTITKKKVEQLENGNNVDVIATLNDFISMLNKVKQALNLSFTAMQNTLATTNYSQSAIDTNKTDLTTKQSSVNTAIDSLQSTQQDLMDANINYDNQVNTAQASVNGAQDSLSTAQVNLRAAEANRNLQLSNAEAEIDSTLAALKLAQSELIKIQASPRRVDLASQEAQVEQYRAALALSQDNLEKTTLISPIDGVVTKVNYEIGEQTSSTEPVIVLVTEGDYSIEVDISETDIVKVSSGDDVKVTFDSLGEDEVFKAKVIFIDPAQTVISDVVYYSVKIIIEKSENSNFTKIKPGMTANIDIMTDRKENVLIIPARAVQSKNGKNYVKILERKGEKVDVKEVSVSVGLNGDDGLVEILNDLHEGQEIVTFVKK